MHHMRSARNGGAGAGVVARGPERRPRQGGRFAVDRSTPTPLPPLPHACTRPSTLASRSLPTLCMWRGLLPGRSGPEGPMRRGRR